MFKLNFKSIIAASVLFGGAMHAQAQTARVQIIHNSPDDAAEFVDVYINGALEFDDFEFRTATPFIDAPAGVEIEIDVAPSTSTDVSESIANFPLTLAEDETYIVVADGITGLSATTYTPAPTFGLEIYALGREEASTATNTDVLVHHGSTDAPTVDVFESSVPAGTIVNDAPYAAFAGYLELGTADYVLEVQDETGATVVASYDAPLETLGLEGEAIVVVASGFLDPSVNGDGPAFGLWVALPTGGALVELPASTARLQVIHNAPDDIAEEVDVYLNGDLLLDNFAFRTASPFVDAPAGVEIEVDIAPATSSDVSESIANFPLTLASGSTYVVVADGITGLSMTSYSPAPAFGLEIYDMGREEATSASNTDVLVHHGSTDAPTVDVFESSIPAGTVVNNASYTDFAGYLELATADYVLEIQNETGSSVVASYDAPLETLGLDGAAITVVASGFLDPSVNGDGPGFGLWVALPAGGALVELPTSTARLQVIHNSPDDAATSVDVYLNGDLLLDDFAFRTASPFIDAPAGVEIEVDIAPASSSDVSESIANFPLTLASGGSYIAVADGITGLSMTSYSPAPAFGLEIYDMAREEATVSTNTDVLVHHGSTDAPTVDVFESAVPAGTIVDNASYTDFAGYLELATDNYILDVQDETGTTTVARFSAPLESLSLEGEAIAVIASGFLDPTANGDGPAFGLWVALPSGGALVELPQPTARLQVIHNSADDAAELVDVYLDGARILDNFEFRTASPFIDAPAGAPISIAVAPSTSTSVDDEIYTTSLTLDVDGSYIAIADGITGLSATSYTPAPAFGLEVYNMAREEATSATNTDVLVHHGSTDAPTVDVFESSVPAGTIVDNASYTDFAGYLELETADYILEVRNAAGDAVVASYLAPLEGLELDGDAITIVASGFLDPSENGDGPAFGLWFCSADGGGLLPLPIGFVGIDELTNAEVSLFPNPSTDFITLTTNTNTLIERAIITDLNGKILMNVVNPTTVSVSELPAGMYHVQFITKDGVAVKNFVKE